MSLLHLAAVLVAGSSLPLAARVPASAEAAYGPNPQQTLRLFAADTASGAPWVLVYLNSGYLKNDQPDEIPPEGEPLSTLLAAGLQVVTATVTYPGQPGVAGGGRFLRPEHPSFAVGQRVERDAFLAWNAACSLADAWCLDLGRGGVLGLSGGSHPAALVAHSGWEEVVEPPRFCVLLRAHTWWPAWVQSSSYGIPAHHFYAAWDTQLLGLFGTNALSGTIGEHQVASSFLDYARPGGPPTLWYGQDTVLEVDSLYPLPEGRLTEGHSPWFHAAGHDLLTSLSPELPHCLLVDPAVAPTLWSWGLRARPTSLEESHARIARWVLHVIS